MPLLASSLAADWSPIYAVEAYEDDALVANAIERRIRAAMAEGNVAIGIVSSAHRRRLERSLPVHALTPRPAPGHCVLLDADAVLTDIMDGQTPDRERFRRRIGALIARSGLEGAPVSVVCEMVGLLRERDMPQASDAILSHWHMLGEQFEFSLLAPCRSWTLEAAEPLPVETPREWPCATRPWQREFDFGTRVGDPPLASRAIVGLRDDVAQALPLRGVVERRIERMLQRSAHEQRGSALLLVNLDRFSGVVETLGQVCAQQLLEAAMPRIAATLGSAAAVDRYGNDEFVVTIDSGAADDAPDSVARRIIAALHQPFVVGRHRVTLAASIGVATSADAGDDPDAMLRHARLAMQTAKRAGGDCVRSYDRNLDSTLRTRFDIEQRLRQALDRDEFVLHYQPVYNLATGEVGSIEALIRWQPLDGATISPAQFIPIAEQTGLIVPIGDWVLRMACADLATLQQAGFHEMRVAVNLSARQLLEPRIAARVQRALHAHGIEPDRLLLELTETMLIEDSEAVAAALWSLKALGASLALDDFGTGFSSLAYLKRVPVDCIKIDQSFVRDVGTDRESEAIIETILAISRTLRLHVIGEGVETEAQLRFLESHGCHAAQGYLLGRPALLSALLPSLQASAAIARRLSLSGAGTPLFR